MISYTVGESGSVGTYSPFWSSYPQLWLQVSGALRLRAEEEPGLYPSMLALQTLNKTVLDQIVTDMPRTFPNNSHFDSTNPASLQGPLLRILRALANTNPKVGYCQVGGASVF